MKCQSCDIHTALHFYVLPVCQEVEFVPIEQKVDIVFDVGKYLCSECMNELAEKIQDMF